MGQEYGKWVDFEAVKASVSIEAVLLEYGVRLGRRVGPHLRGRCPLPQHSSRESRESFIVNTRKNLWICHSQSCVAARGGCAGGDILDLVAILENLSVVEAARRLQDRMGASVRTPCSPEATGFKKKEGASGPWPNALRERNAELRFELHPLDRFHPYLRQRAVELYTATYFQIGWYSGPGTMQDRIVIPIHNRHGRLVAYTGRALKGEPRYRFPSGFQKSLELFNVHRAVQSGSRSAIVVEGFFDCMRVHQAGFSQRRGDHGRVSVDGAAASSSGEF